MYSRKNSVLIRFIAVILTTILVFPIGVNAVSNTVQPRESAYLSSYNAYVHAAGNGIVQVYFNVEGSGTMDELGTLSIQVYECSTNSSNINDWTWKKTFTHDSTSGMLGYSTYYHSGHVDYNGTAGKYYKAYVCVWGGKNGDGDTRYFWTSAKKAT